MMLLPLLESFMRFHMQRIVEKHSVNRQCIILGMQHLLKIMGKQQIALITGID